MWGYRLRVQSVQVFRRDGELPRSRSTCAGFLCVRFRCLAQEQCTQSTGRSFYSGSREALAHCRWPVHVGLPYHAGLQTSRSVTLRFSAGSSSLPLTTSGMSSEGIAHTCGRYGYVTKVFFFFWVLFGPPRNLTTVFFNCNRFTR